MLLNYFDVLILKIFFLKYKINILKNNHYHNYKHIEY